MRTTLCAVLVICTTHIVLAQRRGPPQDEEDESYGNSVRRPNMDVGRFPFPRGETPVFNFDQGDEGFIATIPELIEGLDKIKDIMNKQTVITKAFGEAFDQCEACG
eukprot:TRINITY_DN48055_c0_g1_i1.p1 TRINITY_DN48055_c0_g1~~TRINITY_DN48055_c0_g1_i1.p1  ORF type:complete len:106 (-),score=29.98 TRINITY_DN48055_c0_g1_i1:88-405(-)